MKPTDAQLSALDKAGFKVAGTRTLSIMEKKPRVNPRMRSDFVPSVANVWLDGLLTLRGPLDGGIHGRKVIKCANQQQAFDTAVARVLLGMYDEGVEG